MITLSAHSLMRAASNERAPTTLHQTQNAVKFLAALVTKSKGRVNPVKEFSCKMPATFDN